MSSLDFRELLFHMRPSYDTNCIPVVTLPLIFVDGHMSNVALRRCLSKLNLFQVEYILTKQYNLYLHTPVTFMPCSEHGISQQLSVVGWRRTSRVLRGEPWRCAQCSCSAAEPVRCVLHSGHRSGGRWEYCCVPGEQLVELADHIGRVSATIYRKIQEKSTVREISAYDLAQGWVVLVGAA